jgi:hypothetical protein
MWKDMFRNIHYKLRGLRPTDTDTAYALISKLPATIRVSWKKENGAVIGEITTDDNTRLVTYAPNPIEFVEMVQDAVFTAYDIPVQYRVKYFANFYQPPEEELEKLFSGEKHSRMNLQKTLRTVNT